jgi:hypothetical protein
MAIELVTKDDLQVLRLQLISDIRQMLGGVPKAVDQNAWLKSAEVMKVLKASASTLQTLRANGTLKYTKIGGTLYYDYQHIQKLLDEKT